MKWNACFGLRSTSDDQPGWSVDSNPHPPPLYSQKKWNAHLWITFNSWWLARLVNGLKPHLPPLFSQKWNARFWITFNLWWLAGLVDGLECHLPSLSSQKSEMLIFGLCSTSDDWPGWLMDSNPICYLSPANINEMLVFGLRSTSGDWPSNPSNESQLKCDKRPPKSSKNEILIFISHSTSDDWPSDRSDENWSKCEKMKCIFQLGSSVVSVWVFSTPSPLDGKVRIRATKKFRFFRFTFNKFHPRTILFSLFFTSWQCSSSVMGNVPIGSPYTFTIYSI